MTTKSTTAQTLTLIVGKPSQFDLLLSHGVELPSGRNVARAYPAPYYGSKGTMDAETWEAHKAQVKDEAEAKQRALMLTFAKAHAAGQPIKMIVAIGSMAYGEGVYSQIAAPDAVHDAVTKLAALGHELLEVEPELSARLLSGQSAQTVEPPL